MLKKYIRDWLGIDHDEKINKAKWQALQNDLLDVTDHLQITNKLWPYRIFSRTISSGKITASSITANKQSPWVVNG